MEAGTVLAPGEPKPPPPDEMDEDFFRPDPLGLPMQPKDLFSTGHDYLKLYQQAQKPFVDKDAPTMTQPQPLADWDGKLPDRRLVYF